MEEEKIFTKEAEFYIKAGIKTFANSRFNDFNFDAEKCFDHFVSWLDSQNPILQISYLASMARSIKQKMSQNPAIYSSELDSMALLYGRDAYFLEAVRNFDDSFSVIDEDGHLFIDGLDVTKASDGNIDQLVKYIKRKQAELDFIDETEETLPNIDDLYP